jgi:hypothetical protein
MKDASATYLDNSLSDAIDVVANVIRGHESVMKEYVEQYRNLRQKELTAYQRAAQDDVYGDARKPCLLALVFRSRPISKVKHLHGYYSEEEPVLLSSIWLARISGSNTEHVQVHSQTGDYSPKKIVRLRELRFQHNEQREWTVGVIETVNHLNRVAKRLRDTYLSLVDMHYNIHKTTNALQPSNYHLKLPVQ